MPNSLQPHGLPPTRLLCLWDFPGKNAGVGCHFLPDPGIEPGSPALQADSLPTELQGSPLGHTESFLQGLPALRVIIFLNPTLF